MKFITYDVNTVFNLTLKKLGNVFKWNKVVTFTKMYITGNNTVIFYLNDIEILKVVGC